MRKIFLYATALALITATSCEDELNKLPQQSLSDESAFDSKEGATGVLIGTYSLMQDLHSFGSQPQVIADYMADNVNFMGSFPTLQDINTYTAVSNNTTVAEIWRDNYEPILAANSVIANVPGVADGTFTDDERNQLIGEAKFIRAICYLNLVNLFAHPYQVNNGGEDGVPLILDPFDGTVQTPPRVSVDAVHQQIITDLTDAMSLMDDAPVSSGRASADAARALRSRVYLYREEWQNAADDANTVITNGNFSLAPDYSFYGGNAVTSTEVVFGIANSAIDNVNQGDNDAGSGSWDSYYNGSDAGGRGDAPAHPDLLAAYQSEPGDMRGTLFLKQVGASTDSAMFTTKFNDGANNSSDAPIVRMAEVNLNRAEALAELNGVNQESIDLMNAIRQRAGLPDRTLGDFAAPSDLLDAIAAERRKELAFEGHRRMDLLRRGLPLRTAATEPPFAPSGAGISSPGDDKTILPIPQRERDLNPNLTQNSGY